MVIFQQAAKPFPADDLSFTTTDILIGSNDLVPKSLMIALSMIVLHEVVDRSAQHPLAKEDHTVETLFFR